VAAAGQDYGRDVRVGRAGDEVGHVLGRAERVIGGVDDQHRHAGAAQLVAIGHAPIGLETQEAVAVGHAPAGGGAIRTAVGERRRHRNTLTAMRLSHCVVQWTSGELELDELSQAVRDGRVPLRLHPRAHGVLQCAQDRVGQIVDRRLHLVDQFLEMEDGRERHHAGAEVRPRLYRRQSLRQFGRDARMRPGETVVPGRQQPQVRPPAETDQARPAHLRHRLQPLRHVHQINRFQHAEGVIHIWQARVRPAVAAKLDRQHVQSVRDQRGRQVAGAEDGVVAEQARQQHDAVGVDDPAVAAGQTQPGGKLDAGRHGHEDVLEAGPGAELFGSAVVGADGLSAVGQAAEVAGQRAEPAAGQAEMSDHVHRFFGARDQVLRQQRRWVARRQQRRKSIRGHGQPIADAGRRRLARAGADEVARPDREGSLRENAAAARQHRQPQHDTALRRHAPPASRAPQPRTGRELQPRTRRGLQAPALPRAVAV